ncbi:MAG: maleylpyruvate isomerase N-terminal domain-containing protein [Actinomycetota bacterium]|nr:maleylpyruvate isomerase N-terminal domain-containing protein [Actinomycetota bacterium]
MPFDRSFVEANRVQLERMRAFVDRATDDDLRTPMPAGWTPAAVLGHLAFWDQHALVIMDIVDRGLTPPPHDDATVDWINDTAKRFLVSIEPRAAALLALQIADETDRRIAALSDEQLEGATGRWFTARRWEDRREHVDEIEHALAGGATP